MHKLEDTSTLYQILTYVINWKWNVGYDLTYVWWLIIDDI